MIIMYGLAAACFFGVADFIGGFASKKQSPRATIVISHAVFVPCTIMLSLWAPGTMATKDIWLGLAIGFAAAIGRYLLYRSLAVGVMSVAAPLFGVAYIAVPVLLGLILGASLSSAQIVGLLMATASVVILNLNQKPRGQRLHDWLGSPSLLLPLGAGASLGLIVVLMSRSPSTSGLWLLVVGYATVLTITACSAVVQPFSLISMPAAGLSAGVGVTLSLASVSALFAAREGNVPVAGTLIALAPAFTVMLAVIVLRERLRPRRLIGLLVASSAIVLLAYEG